MKAGFSGFLRSVSVTTSKSLPIIWPGSLLLLRHGNVGPYSRGVSSLYLRFWLDVMLRTMMITKTRDMRDRTSPAEDRMFANWRSLRGVPLPKNLGPEMKEAAQLRIRRRGGGAGLGGRRP